MRGASKRKVESQRRRSVAGLSLTQRHCPANTRNSVDEHRASWWRAVMREPPRPTIWRFDTSRTTAIAKPATTIAERIVRQTRMLVLPRDIGGLPRLNGCGPTLCHDTTVAGSAAVVYGPDPQKRHRLLRPDLILVAAVKSTVPGFVFLRS